MTQEAAGKVILSVFCPGCNFKHEVVVDREYLKTGIQPGRDVELYCIRTDRAWHMTDEEKRNTLKAFADGLL